MAFEGRDEDPDAPKEQDGADCVPQGEDYDLAKQVRSDLQTALKELEGVINRMNRQQQELDGTINDLRMKGSVFLGRPQSAHHSRWHNATQTSEYNSEEGPSSPHGDQKDRKTGALTIPTSSHTLSEKQGCCSIDLSEGRRSPDQHSTPPRRSITSEYLTYKVNQTSLTNNAGSLVVEGEENKSSVVMNQSHSSRGSLRQQQPRQWYEGVDCIRAIVTTMAFDLMCALVILANTALVGIETDLMTRGKYDEGTFFFINTGLNCWFTLELLLRFLAEGTHFFHGRTWRWNLFDTALLMTSIADIALNTSLIAITSQEGGEGSGGGGVLKAIRLMRVVRTLRLSRALRYVAEFRKMVFSLQASLATLFYSLLLLFCVMYCFAILFTQGATEHLQKLPEDELYLESALQVKDAYGSLLRSFYSLYMAISDGRSWGLCLDPLMEVDPFFGVLFLVFVSISLFGVTNVITAVFVESAMSSAQYYKDLIIEDSLRSKEIAVGHMREVFNQIDVDGSGEIDIDEMEEFLKDNHLQIYLESLDITAEDTRLLFRLLDRHNTGLIDLAEFCNGCLRLKGDAKSFDVHVIISQVERIEDLVRQCLQVVEQAQEELKHHREDVQVVVSRSLSHEQHIVSVHNFLKSGSLTDFGGPRTSTSLAGPRSSKASVTMEGVEEEPSRSDSDLSVPQDTPDDTVMV